ncbi:hypothetical protein TCAL_08961, partial [Tigriopus californicus]
SSEAQLTETQSAYGSKSSKLITRLVLSGHESRYELVHGFQVCNRLTPRAKMRSHGEDGPKNKTIWPCSPESFTIA